MSTPYDALNTAVASTATAITGTISTNVPVALGVAGAILGLGVAWRFAKRFMKG